VVGKYDLHNIRIVTNWERRLLNPPDNDSYLKCDCCGDEIGRDVYNIIGSYYCEDCAKEMSRVYAENDDPVECCCCDEPIDDESYFEVGGDIYCEKCFEKNFQE